MCFSAAASFGVGAALIPAGAYCVWSACVKKPRYLPLAAVPIFFGVQQISEGFVWRGLDVGDVESVRAAALFFLFFALSFWPFWFPFLTAVSEPQPKRRIVFGAAAVLATVWFWILFYPLATGPDSLLTIKKEHHSIRYDYYPREGDSSSAQSDGLAVYRYVPRPLLQLLYFASIALPMASSSESWGRLPGIVLGASALAAALLFEYAFVSVWCFFAAVLAVYLVVVFYRLPNPGAQNPA